MGPILNFLGLKKTLLPWREQSCLSSYQGRYGIREAQSRYIAHFGFKKCDIACKNTCFLDLNRFNAGG